MVRGLLRFLAYALVFWFIYRVVIGALRHVIQDARKKPPEPPPQSQAKTEQPPDYRDVKDAHFKDLPNDSSERP
ncbi:MAG: hypothetical protein ABSE41_12275 [Bacteroidota bacterium]